MTDIATVLDAAATAAAGVGKPDVKATGQPGKHAASFFAVLAARMGGQGATGKPTGDGVEPLVAGKIGQAASVKGVQQVLSADADTGMLPPPSLVGVPATLALPFRQSMPDGVAAVPEGVDNPQIYALPLTTPADMGALSAIDEGGSGGSASPFGGAPGGLPGAAQAVADGHRAVDGVARPANSAAGPASRGQLLPSALLARADGELAVSSPAELHMEGMGEEALSVAATTAANPLAMPASTAAGGVATDIAAARPFEHVMRQVESRLHASVDAPVRSPGFASELGEKVVWLAGRQGQVAELSLNPPQMGAVEVRLSLSGGEAGAQFFSANPVVREALEAALPRLRELLAQAGISLGEAQVRDEAFMQGRPSGNQDREGAAGVAGEAGVLGDAGVGAARARGVGLVDLYV